MDFEKYANSNDTSKAGFLDREEVSAWFVQSWCQIYELWIQYKFDIICRINGIEKPTDTSYRSTPYLFIFNINQILKMMLMS